MKNQKELNKELLADMQYLEDYMDGEYYVFETQYNGSPSLLSINENKFTTKELLEDETTVITQVDNLYGAFSDMKKESIMVPDNIYIEGSVEFGLFDIDPSDGEILQYNMLEDHTNKYPNLQSGDLKYSHSYGISFNPIDGAIDDLLYCDCIDNFLNTADTNHNLFYDTFHSFTTGLGEVDYPDMKTLEYNDKLWINIRDNLYYSAEFEVDSISIRKDDFNSWICDNLSDALLGE